MQGDYDGPERRIDNVTNAQIFGVVNDLAADIKTTKDDIVNMKSDLATIKGALFGPEVNLKGAHIDGTELGLIDKVNDCVDTLFGKRGVDGGLISQFSILKNRFVWISSAGVGFIMIMAFFAVQQHWFGSNTDSVQTSVPYTIGSAAATSTMQMSSEVKK